MKYNPTAEFYTLTKLQVYFKRNRLIASYCTIHFHIESVKTTSVINEELKYYVENKAQLET